MYVDIGALGGKDQWAGVNYNTKQQIHSYLSCFHTYILHPKSNQNLRIITIYSQNRFNDTQA